VLFLGVGSDRRVATCLNLKIGSGLNFSEEILVVYEVIRPNSIQAATLTLPVLECVCGEITGTLAMNSRGLEVVFDHGRERNYYTPPDCIILNAESK